MSKLWIIAKEVYRKNVKSWGFFFMVFAPFIIMGVSVLIGYFIANDESSHANETIAIVSQDQGLKDSLAQDNLTYLSSTFIVDIPFSAHAGLHSATNRNNGPLWPV